MAQISDLLGKYLIAITVNHDNAEIILEDDQGDRWKMYHEQDCCESVVIDDIDGNLDDLTETPLLQATRNSNHDGEGVGYDDSHTWTFYKLATIRGYVTIRWYGSSNGYYSESVDFIKLRD